MFFALLADLIVLLHLVVVVLVIGIEAAVVVGARRGWRWIRVPWIRLGHVVAIVFIAVNTVFGVLCPLTEWEHALRRRAGQAVEADMSFVGRLLRAVIYYELPPATFIVAYVTFAGLVLATLVLVPPRWRAKTGPNPR